MAKKFIKSAIKHPGSFKKAAESAGKSTHEFAEEHKHDGDTTGKRARLALTLMSMNKGGASTTKRKSLYSHPRSPKE